MSRDRNAYVWALLPSGYLGTGGLDIDGRSQHGVDFVWGKVLVDRCFGLCDMEGFRGMNASHVISIFSQHTVFISDKRNCFVTGRTQNLQPTHAQRKNTFRSFLVHHPAVCCSWRQASWDKHEAINKAAVFSQTITLSLSWPLYHSVFLNTSVLYLFHLSSPHSPVSAKR